MHICTRGHRHARHFRSRVLFIAAAGLLVTPALAAGPVGAGGPVVVAPPKAPSVTPTPPIIPNNIPSPITAAPGGVTGTAKTASPADDVNSTPQDVSTTRLGTAPTNGSGTAAIPQGIADQASSGTLTSYLRSPITLSAPQPRASNAPIPGIHVAVTKKPSGTALQITTDGKGNAPIGKLTRGASYDIVIGGSTLEPALDRIAGGKTNGGTAQPQKIVAVLIGLLLPAVQKAGTVPSEPFSRAFERGSKDQAIHLTLAIAKDGQATVDWGDGSKLPLGTLKDGTALDISFTAPVPRADANSGMQEVSTTQ